MFKTQTIKMILPKEYTEGQSEISQSVTRNKIFHNNRIIIIKLTLFICYQYDI